MEISSHALELRRADGIHVAVAIFTNLTQDHLDFHPTMEDYFLAKRRLFASPLTDVKVANVDDPYGRRLAEEFPRRPRYGSTRKLTTGRSTSARGFTGTDCTFVTPDGDFAVHVPLPGRFNVDQRARRLGRRPVARSSPTC